MKRIVIEVSDQDFIDLAEYAMAQRQPVTEFVRDWLLRSLRAGNKPTVEDPSRLTSS